MFLICKCTFKCSYISYQCLFSFCDQYVINLFLCDFIWGYPRQFPIFWTFKLYTTNNHTFTSWLFFSRCNMCWAAICLMQFLCLPTHHQNQNSVFLSEQSNHCLFLIHLGFFILYNGSIGALSSIIQIFYSSTRPSDFLDCCDIYVGSFTFCGYFLNFI